MRNVTIVTEKEVLFFDLRQMGTPYEKKYVELVEETRAKVSKTFHTWQQEGWESVYKDIPEFCKSVSLKDIESNGWSLVPSKYVEFANRDEQVDFETAMITISSELSGIMAERKQLDTEIEKLFKELGFDLK